MYLAVATLAKSGINLTSDKANVKGYLKPHEDGIARSGRPNYTIGYAAGITAK